MSLKFSQEPGVFECTLVPPHKTEPIALHCNSVYPVYADIIQTDFVPEFSPLMVTVQTN